MGFAGGAAQSMIGADMEDLSRELEQESQETKRRRPPPPPPPPPSLRTNTSSATLPPPRSQSYQRIEEETENEVEKSDRSQLLDDAMGFVNCKRRSMMGNEIDLDDDLMLSNRSGETREDEADDSPKTAHATVKGACDDEKDQPNGFTKEAKSNAFLSDYKIEDDKEEMSSIGSAESRSKASESNGSITIDDIVIPDRREGHESINSASATGSMTEGLTVLEKLQLAAKLESSNQNMFLKELLETSIQDLGNKEKKRRSLSSSRTPSRRSSKHHSKKHKKKMHRSRSTEGQTASRRGLHRSFDSFASGISASSSASAVPQDVHKMVNSRIRGGEPLPRDDIVAKVTKALFADSKSANCVVLVPFDSNVTEGIGKTTLAGLVCSDQDVRTYYHKAIAWVGLKQKGEEGKALPPLNFERYATTLQSILTQCGISSNHLKLEPFVITPFEDAALADIRLKICMNEARAAMGKILSSSKHLPKKRKTKNGESKSILIVLDDLVHDSDLEWFVFRDNRGETQIINDILITSNRDIDGLVSIPVPPLNEKEAINMVLMEANLQTNHEISKTKELNAIVKRSLYHPLTCKYVGRWFNLKRITGNKGFNVILSEIDHALSRTTAPENPLDVLYALLNQAIAPLVKGKESNTTRLCFASLHAVFSQEFCDPSIPLEVANNFFSSVVESNAKLLSDGALSCPLYQMHGRHAAKLVPEVLGALGILIITKHSSGREKSIQIDHDIIRGFGDYILKDGMQQFLDQKTLSELHECYAKANSDQFNWNDIQPNRIQKYALQILPRHMMECQKLFVPAGEILSEKEFVKTRLQAFGLSKGTKIHLEDLESFSVKFHSREGCEVVVLRAAQVIESMLVRKVDNSNSNSVKGSISLQVGRCLLMISISLGKIGLSEDAMKCRDKSVELVYGSPPSDALSSLLYDAAMLYLDDNNFESAKEIGDLVAVMRANLSGDDSVSYARALCLSGDIAFQESDYGSAESHYKKSIAIFASSTNAKHCHLDLGSVGFKMGRTDYEGGFYEEAKICFDESSEFAENELPPNHEHFVNMYYHMGLTLLMQGQSSDAKYAFKQALTLSKEIKNKSHDLVIRVFLIGGALQSINGMPEDAIENYRGGLALLRKYSPGNQEMIANIMAMIGTEYMLTTKKESAIEWLLEAVQLMKNSVGSTHLTVADALRNLATLEDSIGNHDEAAESLAEAIEIQKSRVGNCIKVAINLTDLGAYYKAAGNTKRSLDAYTSSLLILTELKGEKPQLVTTLLGLAELLTNTREYNAALTHYNDCLVAQKSFLGESHADIASTLYLMGLAEMNLGYYKRALPYFSESVEMMTHLDDKRCSFNGNVYNTMGFLEMQNGKGDRALKRFTEALRVRRALGERLGEAETLMNIGHVYREEGKHAPALEHYEECLNIVSEVTGRDSEWVANVLIAIANVTNDMKSHDDAMSHYQNALQKLVKLHSESHESVASLLQKMGMLQFHAGNLESALLHLEKSVDIYSELGGDSKFKVIPALFVIGNIYNIRKQSQQAEAAWSGAYDAFGGDKVDIYLYPEIKGALIALRESRVGGKQ